MKNQLPSPKIDEFLMQNKEAPQETEAITLIEQNSEDEDSIVSYGYEDDLPDYDEVEEWVGDSSDQKVHDLWDEAQTSREKFKELCDYFQQKTDQAERDLICENMQSAI